MLLVVSQNRIGLYSTWPNVLPHAGRVVAVAGYNGQDFKQSRELLSILKGGFAR